MWGRCEMFGIHRYSRMYVGQMARLARGIYADFLPKVWQERVWVVAWQ